ncbi:MAG: ATP-binding protein [Rhabdochlamydiaceae bacterium]|nr:ATP-binding protein [Rhabdochlamydiaceae bacterium]
MKEIIGRKQEQKQLQKILDSKDPAFLAIYGRRRIGKTYLTKNFFKNKGLFFHLNGIQDAPLDVQLQNFAVEFSDVFLKGKTLKKPKDWFAAFQLLRKAIEDVPKDTKTIVFFDELPWLSTPRSLFLQALEHLWNRYLSEASNIILIVCGSAASWMIENIINNKGGLHGRVTKEMRLLPFTLRETEEFLHSKQIHLDRKQIIELYMCLGGVAKYLSYLEKGKSAAQLIGELCFTYNAPLISEFHKLYRSLFLQYEEHEAIVKALSKSRMGLSYQELLKKTGLSTGGTFSKRIHELMQSGFIAEISSFEESESARRYLLIDEYSLFYLTWNAGVSALDLQNRGPDYWMKQRNSQAWKAWTGHAFECLCLKHLENIKASLGLGAVQTKTSKWKYIPPKGSKESGAEIDLVIERADQCINLCEIKFYEDLFSIDKEYSEKLCRKKECFERITKTRKPTFLTLITTQGTKHNSYYDAIIQQEVNMDSLFLS